MKKIAAKTPLEKKEKAESLNNLKNELSLLKDDRSKILQLCLDQKGLNEKVAGRVLVIEEVVGQM